MFEDKSLVTTYIRLNDQGWRQSGGPWILLSASLVSLCLFILLWLVLFVGYKGGAGFFPKKIYQWSTDQTHLIYGEVYEQKQEVVNGKLQQHWLLRFAPQQLYQFFDDSATAQSNLVPVSYPFNYFVFDKDKIEPQQAAADIARFQFPLDQIVYGKPLRIEFEDQTLNLKNTLIIDKLPILEQQQIIDQHRDHASDQLIIADATGKLYSFSLANLQQVSFPNAMTKIQAVYYAGTQFIKFLSSSATTVAPNGGILSALIGTILLILLTVILVMPLGVIAGIYLHEYAKKGWLYQGLRITLVNLAGVPSIIYGMLGLGFFVYVLGDRIDLYFYKDQLPQPTFGTANLFWAAQVMALLTLPVVIMATEEGLSYIPDRLREASAALGATKIETIWSVLLPESRSAILTGLTLAMARVIAEVAPLLLMGAFSLSSFNVLDKQFPYIDVTHKFQTLGYYIYALEEQHPYVESAESLIYAASALMLLLMVFLNLIVIIMRHRMRHPVSI